MLIEVVGEEDALTQLDTKLGELTWTQGDYNISAQLMENGSERTVLALKPHLASIKVAVAELAAYAKDYLR